VATSRRSGAVWAGDFSKNSEGGTMASNKLSLEKDKDEIRAELKCLVVASPKNLTVGNLAHNYEEATGKKLDTHKFGYQTLTGFIRSMAETFKVERVKIMSFLTSSFYRFS